LSALVDQSGVALTLATAVQKNRPLHNFFPLLSSAAKAQTAMKRLVWLDVAKGLAILFVVYFHFFTTYFEHGSLPPADWNGIGPSLITALGIAWLKVSGLGFHAVGAFIILSGWVLMQSTARRAAPASAETTAWRGETPVKWGQWYRARLLRLYPMYWMAHLVYLISPFVARFEEVDHRIVLSLLGLRFIDITMNFMYLNAAWWYFSMLIQLYLIFPVLFWGAQRLGPWRFLVVASAIGFFTRYLMLIVYPQHGLWILGGFAICRLPEFALGMALGMWFSRSTPRAEWFFLRGPGLFAGVLLYPGALQLYHNGLTYVFVDLATGACCFLVTVGIAGIISHFSLPAKVFALIGAYSYGIFLTHQPYVIWLGLRIREQPIWMFLLIAAATMAVLSLWGIVLEKGTNALVKKLVR
jgi:peptidoglycan/LPS O-acetylase OafA/YrhL